MDKAKFHTILKSKGWLFIGLFLSFFFLLGTAKSDEPRQLVEGKTQWKSWLFKGQNRDNQEWRVYDTLQEACDKTNDSNKNWDVFINDRSTYEVITILEPHQEDETWIYCSYQYRAKDTDGRPYGDIKIGSYSVYKLLVCPLNSSNAIDGVYFDDVSPTNVPFKCECAYGTKASGNQCVDDNAPVPPPVEEKSLGQSATDTNISRCQEGQFCGNPISNTTGNKYEEEQDYLGTGPFPLRLTRHYNSQSTYVGIFGANWSDDFSGSIQRTANEAKVIKPDGQVLTFTLANGVWSAGADILSRLVETKDGAGNTQSWRYTTGEDNTETYDKDGRLTGITNRAGLSQTLKYDVATNKLASVSDPFGRTVSFTFDANNRIDTVTDPALKTYKYAYDTTGNLISVTYPDSKVRQYHYEDSRFPHAMTGLTDENSLRYATWTYDDQGRAKTSEHAGGADKTTIDIDTTNGESKVTDALGRVRTFKYQTLFGAARTVQAKKPSPKGGEGATVASNWSYDDNGNILTFTDYEGRQTTYSYDLTRNLETSRVEEAASPDKRTITTQWHSIWRLPTRIAEPNRITTLVYDDTGTTCGAKGELCSRSIQPTTDTNGSLGFAATASGTPRSWTYKYDDFGQITQIDGPRIDVSDITTFSYTNGNLTQVTDALGHITRFTDYDAHGKPHKITVPNGLVTVLEYDFRQRLISRNPGNELTAYKYDNAGQLTRITQPDSSFLEFTYDAAHRMKEIHDNLGNKITYTLDDVGNRRKEEVRDPTGVLKQTRQREFDALDRLAKLTGARSQSTLFEYDDEDNLTRSTDAVGTETNQIFDGLNRLRESNKGNQDASQRMQYGYDGNDNIISVTDPLNYVTQYTVNGLGDTEITDSPDTGSSKNTYDEAGNLKKAVDARNKTVEYGYDALNRITSIKYEEATVTFSYDQGTNGVGHLTQMTDATGQTKWEYDQLGRVTVKTVTVGVPSVSLITRYSYDNFGRLDTITYHSGQVVKYSYTNGQTTALTLNNTVPLMTGIHYHPFGSADTWTWGNGAAYQRAFDLDGLPSQYDLGGFKRQLTYYPNDLIKDFTDTGANPTAGFGYDSLDRLENVTDASGKTTYTYDANGNRETLTKDTKTITYGLSFDSNRLTSINEASTKALKYNEAGNLASDGDNQFTYDGRGRMIAVQANHIQYQYGINGIGQRLFKKKFSFQPAPDSGTDIDGDKLFTSRDAKWVQLMAFGLVPVPTDPTSDGFKAADCTKDQAITLADVTCIQAKVDNPAPPVLALQGGNYFIYDESGHLLGEYSLAGNPIQEYVWLEEQPVNILKGTAGTPYFIFADHLNTPRAVADGTNKIIWRWSDTAFGAALAYDDPDGNGIHFDLNLRFPGQYFDSETKLHYNYFRDYNPATGRYVQSDPMGLAGGSNIYAYAEANPVSSIDFLGLSCNDKNKKLYGPFTHQINKGGEESINSILQQGSMRATDGQYGDTAVRATTHKFGPNAGAKKPIIEFYTLEKPHNINPGNGWAFWYRKEEGELVDVVVSRIAHTDGSITILKVP